MWCCSIELQIQLVQAYWSEMFVIGLAQCSHVMNLSTILAAILNHLQTRLLHGMSLLSSSRQHLGNDIVWMQAIRGVLRCMKQFLST